MDKGDKWLNSTPFHRACSKGHQAVVAYLVKDTKCKSGIPYLLALIVPVTSTSFETIMQCILFIYFKHI